MNDDELRALALAADQGEWIAWESPPLDEWSQQTWQVHVESLHWDSKRGAKVAYLLAKCKCGGANRGEHDARFIAAANPQAVLALLDRARAAEAEVARLRGTLNKACDWLKRLQEAYDPTDTEDGVAEIERLREGGTR